MLQQQSQEFAPGVPRSTDDGGADHTLPRETARTNCAIGSAISILQLGCADWVFFLGNAPCPQDEGTNITAGLTDLDPEFKMSFPHQSGESLVLGGDVGRVAIVEG